MELHQTRTIKHTPPRWYRAYEERGLLHLISPRGRSAEGAYQVLFPLFGLHLLLSQSESDRASSRE
eukprot:2241300-Rhodomonas_salina.1